MTVWYKKHNGRTTSALPLSFRPSALRVSVCQNCALLPLSPYRTAGSRSAAKANGVWCSCRTNCVSFFGTMCEKQKKTAGVVFTTRTGRPLDRSNIWRDMKGLCESAGVAPEKVFPHSLRHLFARTFYSLERDLSRLADILGHSSIVTTRIYTAESGIIHARQMGRLGLVIT